MGSVEYGTDRGVFPCSAVDTPAVLGYLVLQPTQGSPTCDWGVIYPTHCRNDVK